MGAQVAVEQEPTVEDYLNRWLAHMKGRVRPKTHEGYQGMIRLYVAPTLGPMPLDRLGPMQVQDLYASLLARGLSGGTVLNLHLALTNAASASRLYTMACMAVIIVVILGCRSCCCPAAPVGVCHGPGPSG